MHRNARESKSVRNRGSSTNRTNSDGECEKYFLLNFYIVCCITHSSHQLIHFRSIDCVVYGHFFPTIFTFIHCCSLSTSPKLNCWISFESSIRFLLKFTFWSAQWHCVTLENKVSLQWKLCVCVSDGFNNAIETDDDFIPFVADSFWIFRPKNIECISEKHWQSNGKKIRFALNLSPICEIPMKYHFNWSQLVWLHVWEILTNSSDGFVDECDKCVWKEEGKKESVQCDTRVRSSSGVFCMLCTL